MLRLLIVVVGMLFAPMVHAQTISANPSAPGVLTDNDKPTSAQWMSIMRAQALSALSSPLATKCGIDASPCTVAAGGVTRSLAAWLAGNPLLPPAVSTIGGVLTGTLNWTVCNSGCTFADPLTAWGYARGIVGFGPFAAINIQIADGTYNVANQFYTAEAGMAAVHVVGNCTTPSNVTLNFTNIVGTNYNAFIADSGGRIGQVGAPGVDCLVINGVGARTNRSTWVVQSQGAGAQSRGSGSNIIFGPKVTVQNFYYSVLADQGGRFVGDGATYLNAGDSNLLSRYSGSHIQCLVCKLDTAAHIFTNDYGVTEVLGHDALAEAGASMYVDGSTATGGQIACFAAHTNATSWAHAVTATNCQNGVASLQGGYIEAGHSHITSAAAGNASFATNVMTAAAPSRGAWAVGQVIMATGVAPGTTIASFGTGSGGAGTYNLSTSPGTIASEAVTGGGNAVGAYAGRDSGMNLDGIEITASVYDTVQADGGTVTGSAIKAHDNGGFGLKITKAGTVETYSTVPLLTGNLSGPYYREQASGCTSTSSPCTPDSRFIGN